MENVSKKRKNKQKQSFIKESCLLILGGVAMVGSQLVATASTQVVTKGEIQRLNGELSLVASEMMINNHQKLSDLVLIIGICLSITVIGLILVKKLKKEEE